MQQSTIRARLAALAALALAALLSGCASFNNLTSDVWSFSNWPADRKPSTYAFERLPSQSAQPELQQRLEVAARPALQAAGFTPADDEKTADVHVLLGARVAATGAYYWDDPFWWHGGLYYGRYGRYGGYWRDPWWGPGWGSFPPTPIYEREVALLIRDRRTGQMLYETRASNDGTAAIYSLLPAMFEAAMMDFPSAGISPRQVVTQIDKPR
jgi:hypothetical protein